MPQEVSTIIKNGYNYNAIVWPGPTVVAASAPTALTNTAYDSGYVLLKNLPRIPYAGMFLVIDMPGPISSTGATGSATLAFTVTGSNDGSAAAGYSHVFATINATFTASVGTITNTNSQSVALGVAGAVFYGRLPETRHAYIRVQGATVMTTVTGVNWGLVTIAIQDDADTEANNHADIG